jgi:Rrf2 family protein
MLTNSAKYGIRAVIFLAIYANESNKLGSKEVAKMIKVPAPFLAKILQLLAKKNVISSTKGPNGGFYLTKKDLNNTMLGVVECIDGLDFLSDCFLGLERCGDQNPCAVHHTVSVFKQAMRAEMGQKTITDFANETKEGKSFLFLE